MNHNIKSTPRELPKVIHDLKTYQLWITLHRDFRKLNEWDLVKRLNKLFLISLELAFCLSYMSVEHKLPMLNKAITKLDILKFFIQLAWENKLISTNKYSDIVSRLGEIGRQFGGWKKGLQ